MIYPILGLNGEAGECAEKIKKVIRDNAGIISEEVKESLIKELGDVLWYINATAKEIGTTLDIIAKTNIEKLEDRRDRNVLGGSGNNR